MTRDTITPEILLSLGACEEEVRDFKQVWPKGVKVSEETVKEAVSLGMNLRWLITALGTADDIREFMAVRSSPSLPSVATRIILSALAEKEFTSPKEEVD